MTLEENLDDVLAHLRDARESMWRLMAFSQDWVCRGLVETEFGVLQDMIREFARCQLCMAPRAAGATDVDAC
jgi:hypothetical protein